jgi:hypothetical protein
MRLKTLAVVLLLLVGCTSTNPLCPIEQQIVSATSSALASTLQCSNTAAIQSDLTAAVTKLGLCTTATPVPGHPPKPKLDPFVCGLMSQLVVHAAGSQVPAAWGCTLANASTQIQSVVQTACQAIPGP